MLYERAWEGPGEQPVRGQLFPPAPPDVGREASAVMTAQNPPGGTVHELPADFRKAIRLDAAAGRLWADITPPARNEWICWVTSAKRGAARKRRIEAGIDKMRGGMRRQCCWPGCPHR